MTNDFGFHKYGLRLNRLATDQLFLIRHVLNGYQYTGSVH